MLGMRPHISDLRTGPTPSIGEADQDVIHPNAPLLRYLRHGTLDGAGCGAGRHSDDYGEDTKCHFHWTLQGCELNAHSKDGGRRIWHSRLIRDYVGGIYLRADR